MNPNTLTWQQFPDRDVLVDQLADDIAEALAKAIKLQGLAVIAVSGGSTPKPLFERLANLDIDWSKVVITLVDERWVNEEHELSNAAFLRRYLLDLLESKPTFVPLYEHAENAADSLNSVLHNYCDTTKSTIEQPRPFDVVILGMGNDGHTASFFPDAENIAALVDPQTPAKLLSCISASSQVMRITWSLPILLQASFLILHFTGEDKRKVFANALGLNNSIQLPIGAVIHQSISPLNVYYAD